MLATSHLMDMNSSEDEADALVSPPSALPPPSFAAAEEEPELELNPAQWEVPLEGAPTQPQGEVSDTESDSDEKEVDGLASHAAPAVHDEGATHPEEPKGIDGAGADTTGTETKDEDEEDEEDAEGEAHPIMVVAEFVDALSSDEDGEGILMDVDVLAAEDAEIDAPNVSNTAMAECTAVLDQLLGSVVDASATEGSVAPDADIFAPLVSPPELSPKDLRTDPLPAQGPSEAELEELLACIHRLRQGKVNAVETIHGWEVSYKLRPAGNPTVHSAGDIKVRDPRDGTALRSVQQLLVKLGQGSPEARAPRDCENSEVTGEPRGRPVTPRGESTEAPPPPPPPPPLAASSGSSALTVGQRVEARYLATKANRQKHQKHWLVSKQWHKGTISAVHPDGCTFDINYDDGDLEHRVQGKYVRILKRAHAVPTGATKTPSKESHNGSCNDSSSATPEPPRKAARHSAISASPARATTRGPSEMLPDEARAAAAAEGLELVPSPSNQTSFKGVSMSYGGKYTANVSKKGKMLHLGTFATPEEAALIYARHIGAERAAAEAAEARVAVPQPLTADEARAAAAAEGLELVPSSNETGFKGVRKDYDKYRANVWKKDKMLPLGTFATPEEAALIYARRIRAERVAVEMAEARSEGPKLLTADEARAAATAEGLELMPSMSNETGFMGVHAKDDGRYHVRIRENGKQRYLGAFVTSEEAALCYARHVGAERAAAEAEEARLAGPQPLTADEARAAAAAEGLELVPSPSNETGFKGVNKNHSGKFVARFKEKGKHLHLGTFATSEEAALCYAKHIGAKQAAAKAAKVRGEGPQPLTADEARAAAAAEGVELVPSPSNESGFKGVRMKHHSGKFVANVSKKGKAIYLGTFATPEEAALSYARHFQADMVKERGRAAKNDSSTAAASLPAVAASSASTSVSLAASSASTTTPPQVTFMQRVYKIRSLLQLDTSLGIPDAIREARRVMGAPPSDAPLPAQVNELLGEHLGIDPVTLQLPPVE